MSPELGDLIAALPDELRRESGAQEELQSLLARMAHRPVPTGSLWRLWAMGGVQAKIALAYAAYWIRSGYATADERERRLNETHLTAAIKLLAGMTYLRGLAMKIGQLLSAYPKIMPAQFVETLGRLQFDAPPMHYSLLREHLHNELGGDPREIFAEFETRAFAAASLGQVHRARLRSGERVAVKIQYPNIARTVRDDFRSLSALLWPMRLKKDWDNLREQIDDMRRMLELETNYVQEAEFAERARGLFTEADDIVVPRMYREYSTGRVLTMDYVDGVHLDGFLATHPTQAQRDRFGELILRASFRTCGSGRLWYADPHPGNLLFMPDGRLGLIDFGCCRAFDAEEWEYFKSMSRAYFRGDEAIRQSMVRSGDFQCFDEIDPEFLRLGVAWSHWIWAGIPVDEPFDFGSDEYIQRGIDLVSEVISKRQLRSKPVNNWLFRNVLGNRAILYRLKARVNINRINKEEGGEVYEPGILNGE